MLPTIIKNIELNKVYKQVEEFVIQSIPEEEQGLWEKAQLNVAIQPSMISIGGSYKVGDHTKPLDIRNKQRNRPMVEILREFHNMTTPGGLNKWNRAQFSIAPSVEPECELLWDQEW